MNKTEFVSAIAEKAEITKAEAARVVSAEIDIITEALKSREDVAITGFGKFTASHSEARTCRNPQTGETMTIPAKYTPKFKAGQTLKENVE